MSMRSTLIYRGIVLPKIHFALPVVAFALDRVCCLSSAFWRLQVQLDNMH